MGTLILTTPLPPEKHVAIPILARSGGDDHAG